MRRGMLLVALLAAVVGACTLFEDELPDDTCRADTDCFRAQGERCNLDTNRCEVSSVDAGVADGAGADAP